MLKKTSEELRTEYMSLVAEAKECIKIAEEGKKAEKRLSELRDWRGAYQRGLINLAKIEYEDSLLPEFNDRFLIKSIDNKWIYLREKGYLISTREFKLSNGWPKSSRDGYGKIDAELALKIWKDHLLKNDKK